MMRKVNNLRWRLFRIRSSSRWQSIHLPAIEYTTTTKGRPTTRPSIKLLDHRVQISIRPLCFFSSILDFI